MEPHNKIRVLLIDDDEDDFLIIRNIMRHMSHTPFTFDWARNSKKGLQRIEQNEHDVYLVDYRLDDMTGLDLLSRFNLTKRTEPFIILTGAGDEQVEQKAMQMGVADYLVKGTFDAQLLSRVLRYSLQRKNMEAQRVQQLVELNRSKDEFIALASHQLRTPATAVKQYVGMALEGYGGDLTDDMKMLLTQAFEGNERQLQIVNDILRVAKLDLEKIVLQKKVTDINPIAQQIVEDIQETAHQRQQTISFDSELNSATVDADIDYLRMAIGNLVDNASKYTPEGKRVRVMIRDYDEGRLSVNIIDEGVGIAKEDIPKLFRKFSRIDNPLSVVRGGTGLGLYWSNKIIKMHDGNIKVNSKIDKGTRFCVILPFANTNNS